MADGTGTLITKVLDQDDDTLLQDWVEEQLESSTMRRDLLSDAELRRDSAEFLRRLRAAVASGSSDINAPGYADLRELLNRFSRERALKGFTPAETATFVFSIKPCLFDRMRQATDDSDQLAEEIRMVSGLLDKLGLFTTEIYQRSREEVINRHQQELLELSTPVVKIWDRVLAVPLIGTLDSARTQIVMENLLQRIVETEAEVAIIDITGVPTVDTLVAQHLIKTVAAARLMGAECIISGIRPQIAQTIVHLGVTLEDAMTKASLADAFSAAIRIVGYGVTKVPTAR